jgi:long-chain acyl-CoA synthetase
MHTPQTLPELFEQSVRKFSSNTMVLQKREGSFTPATYAEIRTLVHRCAAGLMNLGVKKGDRIALVAEGRKEWVVAELGILYAGGINVPISIKIDEPSELAFRLNHAGCRMIIVSGPQAPKILRILPEVSTCERVIVLDPVTPAPGTTLLFDDLLSQGEEFLGKNGAAFEATWKALRGSDAANICYTSGTTADPKGIVLTHRNYTANIAQGTTLYPLPPGSCTLLILPWDHAFAHTCGIYALASTGGAFACVQLGKSPMETLRNIPVNIREVRPTFLLSVPALAKNFRKGIEKSIREKGQVPVLLLRAGLAVGYAYQGAKGGAMSGTGWRALLRPLVTLFDLILFAKIRENFGGRIEYFIGGGALLDIELQRFFYAIGMPMYQGYGLTEAAPVISSNTPEHHKLGSSGILVPDLDVTIRDEKGNVLPSGERGEIVVRGENVMAGYWNNPRATEETLRGGWLYTGDLGHLDGDGYLYVLGREKSLLISQDGEKYSPEGIEETIVDRSRFVDQVLLHNDHSPYTVALLVPNREALLAWMKHHGHDPRTAGGQEAALLFLRGEVDPYRPGGKFSGLFPERWLPSAIAILAEPFTEQNRFLNSTLKMVRGRITEHYRARIDAMYAGTGKEILNDANRQAITRLGAGD